MGNSALQHRRLLDTFLLQWDLKNRGLDLLERLAGKEPRHQRVLLHWDSFQPSSWLWQCWLSCRLNPSPLNAVFCVNRNTSTLLESVPKTVTNFKSILVVGGTATGKSTIVQFVAEKMGRKVVLMDELLRKEKLEHLAYKFETKLGV